MQTCAATQLSAHRSCRGPRIAPMRVLALGLGLPSLAVGHLPSGGGPQLGSEAFLRHAGGRTFPFFFDDSIFQNDHSAILDPIVNDQFKGLSLIHI